MNCGHKYFPSPLFQDSGRTINANTLNCTKLVGCVEIIVYILKKQPLFSNACCIITTYYYIIIYYLTHSGHRIFIYY